MSARENVVYNYSPEFAPAIRYRAIPSSCTGAAETLAEARAAYRSDLSGLLRVGRCELPPVVEHVETKVLGILVREKVGAVHRDLVADRMLLQTLLADGQAQQELRAYLDSASGVGVEPVVVLADPQDTVDSVLEQMTGTDAVVVAHCDPARAVGWAAIYGPEVDAAVDAVDAPGGRARTWITCVRPWRIPNAPDRVTRVGHHHHHPGEAGRRIVGLASAWAPGL